MNPEFQHLLDDTTHADPTVRIAALDAIGQWSAMNEDHGESAQAVPHVAAALHDPDRDVRWAAAYALGALGLAEAAGPLLDALNNVNGDDGLKLVIVKALGKVENRDAVDALAEIEHSTSSRCLRAAAVRSLARITA